jgi:hypothetical protein
MYFLIPKNSTIFNRRITVMCMLVTLNIVPIRKVLFTCGFLAHKEASDQPFIKVGILHGILVEISTLGLEVSTDGGGGIWSCGVAIDDSECAQGRNRC